MRLRGLPQLRNVLRVRNPGGSLVLGVPRGVHPGVVKEVFADFIPRVIHVVGDEDHRGGVAVRHENGPRLVPVFAVALVVLGTWVAVSPPSVPGLTEPGGSPSMRMEQ